MLLLLFMLLISNSLEQGTGDILGHIVESPCEQYTPVGPDLIPTGELATVEV